MSYARWGENGSSVYVFASVGGFVECCGCSFETHETAPYTNALGMEVTFTMGSRELHSAAEVVTHMREHIAQGEYIPAYLLDESLYAPSDFQTPQKDTVTHG